MKPGYKLFFLALSMTATAIQGMADERGKENMKTDLPGDGTAAWTRIDYKGWSNAYRFQTTGMVMVVVGDIGARVMEYGAAGRNVLWQDPALFGAVLKDKGVFFPGGSQFDLMGERVNENREPSLWVGEYSVDIKSPTHLTAVSQIGTNTGLQIVRDIVIEPLTGKAVITQTVFNKSRKKMKVSIWDRTWTAGPCLLAAPVETDSQWPEGWSFGAWQALPRSSNPEAAEQFQFADGILTITPTGKSCQIIMKSKKGWFAYGRDNLLYVKRYAVGNGVYPLVNCPVSLWLSKQEWKEVGLMAEMEPMSPLYDIGPGESCRFQEEWLLYLLDISLEKPEQLRAKLKELNQMMK